MPDNEPKNLRQRAEDVLRGKPINVDAMSPQEIERLFYELQLHEIELRLQNEELRQAQRQVEESRQKYADLYDFAPVGYLTINQRGLVEEANLTVTTMLNIGREQLFQQPFVNHVVPAHQHIYFAHQQRLWETGRHQRDELQLVKGNGVRFYAQLDSTLVEPGMGEPDRHHMVVMDIDQRKQSEIAEYEHRIFAESLHTISTALNSTLNLDEVLSLILINVNYVIQHDVAEVMLFEEGYATVVGSKGYAEHGLQEKINQMRLPIDQMANLSQMVRSGQPVIIADVQTDPAWVKVMPVDLKRAYIGAPIHLNDQVIGCLNVFNQKPGFYTETHAERLKAFAGQTATAIKNAQLYQQAQQVATLRERQRLARDLHDAVSQTLFSASMIAEALPKLSERSPDALSTNLDKLLILTRGAMAEMRSLLLELRPDQMQRYSLSELLKQLAEALQGRKQIAVDLHLANNLELSAEKKEVIYRVAQEALNNVIKHSQATQVAIQAVSSPQQFELTIRDNGRGFDPEHVSSGIGLYSMHERAQTIDAGLTVESAAGEGTTVTLAWHQPA